MKVLLISRKALCLFALLATAVGCMSGVDPQALNSTEDNAEQSVEVSENSLAPEAASLTGDCSVLLDTAPRGLACLHCQEPSAGSQPEALVSVMFNSCLKNVATNYMVDNSFSHNEGLLRDHITRLSSNGRRLFVQFYFHNGARQRAWRSQQTESFAASISPEQFRSQIFTDPVLLQGYTALVQRMVPVIEYALSRGAVVLVVPSLEDNLTNESFEQLYRLTGSALGPLAASVRFGRSACENCYSGNESGVPEGVFPELHTDWPILDVSNSVVTNDGRDYAFDEATAESLNVHTLNGFAPLRDNAGALGNVFILWSAGFQGLTPGSQSNSAFAAPGMRNYVYPDHGQQEALIRFLRGE